MAEQNTTQQSANTSPNDGNSNNNVNNNSGSDQGQGVKNKISYSQEQVDSISSASVTKAFKSFFDQYGITEEEANQALTSVKEAKGKNKPDINTLTSQNEQYKKDMQKAQIENKAILEAINLGVDTKTIPYIMKLADFSAVSDEHGKINGEKIKGAISKVLEDMPQLKKQETNNTTGFHKIGADGNNSKTSDETNTLRKAFGLKPKD